MAEWRDPPAGRITEHFWWGEAACRCCGQTVDREVVAATAAWLEQIRDALGDHPLHVNSWCRCPTHNARVGGAPQSLHLEGLAVDITSRAPGMTPHRVQGICRVLQRGGLVGGLGIYAGFTHVDRGRARTWEG